MWKGLEGQVYSWQHRMLLQDHQFLGMVLPLLAAPKAAHRNCQEENKKDNRYLTLTHSRLSNKKVPEPIRASLVDEEIAVFWTSSSWLPSWQTALFYLLFLLRLKEPFSLFRQK